LKADAERNASEIIAELIIQRQVEKLKMQNKLRENKTL
jgi:hypothetical protein